MQLNKSKNNLNKINRINNCLQIKIGMPPLSWVLISYQYIFAMDEFENNPFTLEILLLLNASLIEKRFESLIKKKQKLQITRVVSVIMLLLSFHPIILTFSLQISFKCNKKKSSLTFWWMNRKLSSFPLNVPESS